MSTGELSLTNYLQKAREQPNRQKVEQEIEKTKKMLENLEKNHGDGENIIVTKLNCILKLEKNIIEYYDVEDEELSHGIGKIENSVAIKKIERSIQNMYKDELKRLQQLQPYIEKTHRKCAYISQKLQTHYLHIESPNNPQKRVSLPEPTQLHNQVLQQISSCQLKFNTLMQKFQIQIQNRLKRMQETENKELKELANVVEVRISQIEKYNLQNAQNAQNLQNTRKTTMALNGLRGQERKGGIEDFGDFL